MALGVMGSMMLDKRWPHGQMMWMQRSVQNLAMGWIQSYSTEEGTLSTSSCVS
jgi:hypothetical protein